MKFFNPHSIFRILFLSIIALFFMMIILVAVLPSIVSTNWFRGYVVNVIHRTVKQPVTIENVEWHWSSGITISGITIENDPLFSDLPLFFLKTATIQMNFNDIFSGRISAGFSADNIRIVVIKDKNGRMNTDMLGAAPLPDKQKKDPTEEDAASNLVNPDFSFSLPVDIQFDVNVDNISFLFKNKMDNQEISIEYGAVTLSMPSLFYEPVNAGVSGNLQLIDGEPLPFNFNVLIKNNQISEKVFTLEDTLLQVKGKLPGVNISLDGDLSDKGIKGAVHLDMNPVFKMISPFTPKNISESNFNGDIILTLDASMMSNREMAFNTELKASKISITGEIVQNRTFMPMNASLMLNGNFSFDTGDLVILKSTVNILNNSHIDFNGSVSGLISRTPKADFIIGPVFVDIEEVSRYITPLIPDDLKFQYSFNNGQSFLSLDKLRFKGNPVTGYGQFSLVDSALSIPDMRILSEDTEISVLNVILQLKSAEAELKAYFPEKADISLILNIDSIDINGKSSIHIKKAEIPQLKIDISDIAVNPQALFGVSGVVSLYQSMKLTGVNALDQLSAKGVSQILDAECRLYNIKKADIIVRNMNASVAEVTIDHPSTGKIKTAADMTLTLPALEINNLKPFTADIHDADITATLGDFVRLNITADAKNTARTDATAKGRMTIDLGRLKQYLPEKRIKELTLSGLCSLNWELKGRVPTPSEINKIAGKGIFDLENDLPFIEHIDTDINIAETKFDMNITEKNRIGIGAVSAMPLIHYIYKKGKGDLKSHINIGGITEIPGVKFHTPVSGQILFSIVHDGLERVMISQEFISEELKVKEALSADISEIRQGLEKYKQNPIQLLLKTVGADIKGSVQIDDCSVLNRFQNTITVSGALDLNALFRLVPGQSTSAGISSDVRHLSFNMENLFFLKDLHGKLNFFKIYDISSQKKLASQSLEQRPEVVADLLSRRVMQTARSREGNIQLNAILNPESIVETRLNPDQSIMFSSARSSAGPLPIELSGFMAEIGLNRGLPELRRFQVDLLHGTIAGAVTVFKQKDLFFVYTDINFTGIDTAAFFPKQKNKNTGQDTEISGRVTLYLPVSTKLNTTLENFNMDLFFSHIGGKALESLFYAVDPYENNEAIVTQRRILKTGSPRFVRIEVNDGRLSMAGEINLKGAKMQPIDIEPISITDLSGFNKFEGILDVLAPVIEILQIASSSEVQVGGDAIEFQ